MISNAKLSTNSFQFVIYCNLSIYSIINLTHSQDIDLSKDNLSYENLDFYVP